MKENAKKGLLVTLRLPSGGELVCEVESVFRNSNTISLHPVRGFFPWDEFVEAEGVGNLVDRLSGKFLGTNPSDYFNIKLSPKAKSFYSMLGERHKKSIGTVAEGILEQIAADYTGRMAN